MSLLRALKAICNQICCAPSAAGPVNDSMSEYTVSVAGGALTESHFLLCLRFRMAVLHCLRFRMAVMSVRCPSMVPGNVFSMSCHCLLSCRLTKDEWTGIVKDHLCPLLRDR